MSFVNPYSAYGYGFNAPLLSGSYVRPAVLSGSYVAPAFTSAYAGWNGYAGLGYTGYPYAASAYSYAGYAAPYNGYYGSRLFY